MFVVTMDYVSREAHQTTSYSIILSDQTPPPIPPGFRFKKLIYIFFGLGLCCDLSLLFQTSVNLPFAILYIERLGESLNRGFKSK